ncbi:hypothetical protein SUGI_0508900 [Cryptomeria japonica]|nr:hypothetical protein SUGI_0508900 [Cryptomeria japonica]
MTFVIRRILTIPRLEKFGERIRDQMREEFTKLKQQVKELEEELEKRRALHHKRGDVDPYHSKDVLNVGKKEVANCHACDSEEEEEDEYEEIDEFGVGECLLEDREDEDIEVAAATKQLGEMEAIEGHNNQVAAVKE